MHAGLSVIPDPDPSSVPGFFLPNTKTFLVQNYFSQKWEFIFLLPSYKASSKL
jgi:hypothetical protein